MDIALLLARVFFGLGLAGHGAQKLFGWFGGHGLRATGIGFETIGFRPGRLFATAAALGEFGGGVLTALGLLGPVGPALMLLVMLVAATAVHLKNGFFVTTNGVEMPMLYAMASLLLVFIGPGRYALDTMFGWLMTAERTGWIAVAMAVAGALVTLAIRRPSQPAVQPA